MESRSLKMRFSRENIYRMSLKNINTVYKFIYFIYLYYKGNHGGYPMAKKIHAMKNIHRKFIK